MTTEFQQIGTERPTGFALCGEQFRFRGVTPADYSAWLGESRRADDATDDEDSPTTWSDLCDQADALVLLGLYPDDHERYKRLRAGDLGNGGHVPTVHEVIALRNWVMEVETGRPPLQVTASSDGPGSSDPSSEEESSQEEEIPDA